MNDAPEILECNTGMLNANSCYVAYGQIRCTPYTHTSVRWNMYLWNYGWQMLINLYQFFQVYYTGWNVEFCDCNSLFKNMLPFPVTLLILGEIDVAVSLGGGLHIGLHCRI